MENEGRNTYTLKEPFRRLAGLILMVGLIALFVDNTIPKQKREKVENVEQIMASINTGDLIIAKGGYVCPADVEVKADGTRSVWSHCGQGPAQTYGIIGVVHVGDASYKMVWSCFVHSKLVLTDGPPDALYSCDAKH